MVYPLDGITRRRLLVIRHIFDHSVTLSENSFSSMARVLAVVGFDHCNESALRTLVLSAEPSQDPPDSTFGGILERAEKLSGLQVPRGHVFNIRRTRNDAQHKGRYPDASEVNDCRTHTKDFLIDLCKLAWDVDLFAMSLSELIGSASVKHLMTKAEGYQAKGELLDAVRSGMAALELALDLVGSATVQGSSTAYIDFESADIGAREVIRKLQIRLVQLMVGLDLVGYEKIVALVGHVSFLKGGTYNVHVGRFQDSCPPTVSDCQFVLGFCVESILRIQERVGDLEKPFKL